MKNRNNKKEGIAQLKTVGELAGQEASAQDAKVWPLALYIYK